ncbi:MAG: CinA family protein [Candidatus Thorarchaeota archaeon]
MSLLKRIKYLIEKFTEKKILLAIAESCTGGYISHMFTNISGASNVFERGVVCYSNKSKVEVLNVDLKSIEAAGAVSVTVARQLAYNIRILSNVDIGIGITGIAGPTGGTKEKPVGLVYIGYSTKEETKIEKYFLQTDRIHFKELVLEKVLEYLENITLEEKL